MEDAEVSPDSPGNMNSRTRGSMMLAAALLASACGGNAAADKVHDEPAAPAPRCGDGHVDLGEECDAGEMRSDVFADACRTDCTKASCGDSVLDTGEECDVGVTPPGDSASCSSSCTTFSWRVREPRPAASFAAAACELGGKVYLTGGHNAEGSSKRLDEFDPELGTWTEKASMAVDRGGHSCEVVNGKLFVFGGATLDGIGRDSVEEYDPSRDRWVPKSSMLAHREFHSGAVIDGRVYLFGGNVPTPRSVVAEVDEYDVLSDRWTRMKAMPTPRWGVSAEALDASIYVVGGALVVSNAEYSGLTERYDPASDSWETKAPTENASLVSCSVVLSGNLIVAGGNLDRSALRLFNPSMNSWTLLEPMPEALEFITCAAVGSSVFVFGGRVSNEAISTVLEYGPD